METRKLEHFIELAMTGSFSRAAINLHLTQSALSKSIQSLEAEIGVQLIERMGRKCTTTTAGAAMVARARNLLNEVDNLAIAARGEGDMSGTLRVGFGAGPGASMTASLITHFLGKYPKVKLLLRRGTAEFLMSALRDRSIDVVLIDTRSLTQSDDLHVESIGALKSGIMCRSEHPLTLKSSVTLEDVLQFPILCTAVSDEAARMTQAHFGLHQDIRISTVVESEELEPLVAAAIHSDAIFFAVTGAATEQIAAGKLRVISIEKPMKFSVPISIVRLASKGESHLLGTVKDFALKWFETADEQPHQAH